MTAIITSIVKNPSTRKVAAVVGKSALTAATYAGRTAIALVGVNAGFIMVGAASKGIDKLKQKIRAARQKKMHQPESINQEP
jgi:hypothetical protein